MADGKKSGKINKLNTKLIPAILMLSGAAVAVVMCVIGHYKMRVMLFSILIASMVFFLIGMIIKHIVDRFDMKPTYDDYFRDLKDD